MKTDCNETPEVTASLGKALKDARLAESLSVEEVAEQLHLSLSTVRDIEDNLVAIQKEKKYPVIYLRGYLSNYAKLVALDDLDGFDEFQQLVATPNRKEAPLVSGLIIPPNNKRSKMLPLSFLLLVIVGTVFYQYQQLASTDVEQSQSFSTPTPANDVFSANSTALNLDVKKSSAESSESEQLMRLPVGLKQLNSELPVSVIAPVVEINDAIKAQPEVPEQANISESVPAEVDAQVVKKKELKTEMLTLGFNGECWTEVYDATGKRIAYGLYKQGRTLKLSGVAPFKLKLGDPSVVDIQYKDQVIKGDFTPGRSAKFSVPLT